MRSLKFAVLLSALMLGGVSSVLAGVSGVVQTNVKLLVPPDPLCSSANPCTYPYTVTYTTVSPALNNFVGYEVTIANTGKNNVNNVTFTGTLTISAPDETASFLRADGAACTNVTKPTDPVNQTKISCAFGTLSSGQSVPKFQVFFKSPLKKNTTGSDAVSFSGVTFYSETTNGGAPSPKNSQSFWGPANGFADNPSSANLKDNNPHLVSTTIPASTQSQTIFTGDGFCGSSSGYPFVTQVAVPPSPTLTSAIALFDASASDSSSFCSNSANFNTCYSSQISIPGGVFTSAPWLSIVLRISSSNGNIKTNDITRINLQYTDGSAAPVSITGCLVANTPNGDGVPCIAARKTYTSLQADPALPPGPQCFEWTLLNIRNGSYRVF